MLVDRRWPMLNAERTSHNLNPMHLQDDIWPFEMTHSSLGRSLATFNVAPLVLQELKAAMLFALELMSSKTLRGLVYFALQL